MDISEREFMTTSEACHVLAVSKTVIKRMSDDGTLKTWKTPGGHRRLDRNAVLAIANEKFGKQSEEADKNDLKVLVIDDDPVVSTLFKGILDSSQVNFQLVTAKDGFDGLVKAGKQEYDIIFVDLSMPKLDGYEVVNTIRNSVQNQDVTIIVITAYDDSEIQLEKLPVDIVIMNKPLNIRIINQFIRYEARLLFQ